MSFSSYHQLCYLTHTFLPPYPIFRSDPFARFTHTRSRFR